jgi:hypothetical protein
VGEGCGETKQKHRLKENTFMPNSVLCLEEIFPKFHFRFFKGTAVILCKDVASLSIHSIVILRISIAYWLLLLAMD